MNRQIIKKIFFLSLLFFFCGYSLCRATGLPCASDVFGIIHKVNKHWQNTHPKHSWSFWDQAAYHTGNMEAYFLTGDTAYYNYSEAWAERNLWMGARSKDKSKWKSGYGETDEYVLFGDFQICFQTYIDLYTVEPDERKIARAREVMEYEMSTDKDNYWWWADGLYMVMPVMTKLYKVTGNRLYLEKLHEYWVYANNLMYDAEAGLYYRDRKYVYPEHKSTNGKKDFWARGDGWVLAALAKVLKDLPEDDKYRREYTDRFRTLAKAVAACQQPEGYWTRSMLDPQHAPGPETSGTAFFTYGLLWGINNGLLDKATYEPVVLNAWKYLSEVALQPNGAVGYVQPIGEKAIPGQVVNANSTANFGVGAFLLAACEMARYADGGTPVVYEGHQVTAEGAWCWFADPRALHHRSKDGCIDKTYVGYIDTHGNIKAMQYDFIEKQQQEVLIRSYFQPDDHDNPTFLVLPDERVMIFYSRHTDERCFYYRVSQKPGDITTLGEEKKILTKHNTTYPSPFILSDDPEHIYLCWRGMGWHPTIAKLSLPDKKDNVKVEWGPYQLVQSTGARPYAKYASNGKDKIFFTYTTGHPDQESPNYLYFNYIDIRNLQLTDVKGNVLSGIADGPFQVTKKTEYVERYPYTVVDDSGERDWVWQVTMNKSGHPVIAMTRISKDKASHNYYYAHWTGTEWEKRFLAHAGGHFHQSSRIEKCYSGGMAIDPVHTDVVYCSVPVEGKYGRKYEILKYRLSDTGEVAEVEAVTRNSRYNNVRPYVIPDSEATPLRLAWMHGYYYDWIVSAARPQGYATAIHADFQGFPCTEKESRKMTVEEAGNFSFDPKEDFTVTVTLKPDTSKYQGCLLRLGKLEYHLNGDTMKPEVRYKRKTYAGTNVLGTADTWTTVPRSTNGQWHASQKYSEFRLKLEYTDGVLRTYINGMLDQTVELFK